MQPGRWIRAVGETPGPGQYKPERALNNLDAKRDANIKRSSSMFLSSTKRTPYEGMKDKEKTPAPGLYDASQGTIQDSLRKRLEGGSSNPLLANLKAKGRHSGAVPFNSKLGRFENRTVDENDAYLGPGYYEHKSFVEGAQSRALAKNQSFMTGVSEARALTSCAGGEVQRGRGKEHGHAGAGAVHGRRRGEPVVQAQLQHDICRVTG